MVSGALISMVKRHEGLRLQPYWDVKGYSIGYGYFMGNNKYMFGSSITETKAEQLLVETLNDIHNKVGGELSHLSQNQREAVYDFIYNVGMGNYKSSTLRKVLLQRNPDPDKVAGELRRWVYAGGKKKQGLSDRREDEIKMYKGGGNGQYVQQPVPGSQPLQSGLGDLGLLLLALFLIGKSIFR